MYQAVKSNGRAKDQKRGGPVPIQFNPRHGLERLLNPLKPFIDQTEHLVGLLQFLVDVGVVADPEH